MRILLMLLLAALLIQGCIHDMTKAFDVTFYSTVTDEVMNQFAMAHKKSSDYETMKSIHSWMITNMTWEQDSWGGFLDYPRDPKRTLKRKRGDCEDFAALAIEVLKINKIESYFLAVTKNSEQLIKGGHCVCLVKINNYYYHIGNYKNIYGPFTTIENAAISIYPEWFKYEVKDENFKTIKRKNNE